MTSLQISAIIKQERVRIIAKKLSSEQIQQIHTLYQQIGTYSGVAKQIGISAATVAKYVKASDIAPIINSQLPIVRIAAKPIEQISIDSILTFSVNTAEEKRSYQEWLKEFNR